MRPELVTWSIDLDSVDGVSTKKMSPNRPPTTWPDFRLRRFPEPSAKRPPWPKIKGAFWARHLGSRAGIPALICFTRAVLAAPQHGTHCPQAPWPEEQSWLKRKTFSALPRKSCRLNRVVTRLDVVITWTVGTPRQRHQSCVGVRQYSTVWRGEECDQRENHKHEHG